MSNTFISQTDRYFGTLFLDLPTAMFQYIETNEQKFIITMKNPTDRVISEYFYPFIQVCSVYSVFLIKIIMLLCCLHGYTTFYVILFTFRKALTSVLSVVTSCIAL